MFQSGFLIFLKTPNHTLSHYLIDSIIFNTENIPQLCLQNHWNLHGVLLVQLKLGLLYHDLGLIKKCLKYLTSEYEILAIEITLNYIASCFINQKEFKENHNFFYLLIKTLTTFIVKGLNSRINNLKPSFLPCPLNIHLNQLPQYCFLSSTFKDINELAQTLYVFRHLQNSIFDHLKYTQCFIDLNNFKSSLVSYELDSLKQLSNDPVTSILALNKKLILGKTPTCILSICKWGDTKGCSALHRLKLYGKNLSYRLLCSEKLENPLVFTIIRNLGMHVNQELRQIAFATIRRDVRETLLIHLEHVGRISKKEKNDIDFLRSLEAILPNQSYSSAKQRSWFQALRKPKITLPIDKTKAIQLQQSFFALKASQKPLKDDSSILIEPKPIKTRSKLPCDLLKALKSGVLNEILRESRPNNPERDYKTMGCDLDDFKESNSYLKFDFFSSLEQFYELLFHHPFTNLNEYNLPFLEKPPSEDSSGFFPSEPKAFSHCLKCKQGKMTGFGLLLREKEGYFQGCLDWTQQWDSTIKQKILLELQISQKSVDLQVLLDFYLQNHDWLSLKNLLKDIEMKENSEITEFFEKNLQKTTIFLRETIKNFFAETWGLYFNDEKSNLKKKLQRLAKIGNLFPNTCFISSYPMVFFDSFLQSRRNPPTVKPLLKFPSITTEVTLEILQFLVNKGYLLILDEYLRFHGLSFETFNFIKKTPASYLTILSREPITKLFELGMRNAEWLTGANSLNGILLEKRIFRVLGVLMYAKIDSFEIAFEASEESSLYINKILFEESLNEFPDLKPVVLQAEFEEKELQLMLERGELESMEQDMSLLELIDQNSYFSYKELLKDPIEPIQKGIKLHEAFIEDFMYFLYISRPFEAFISLFKGVIPKDWLKYIKVYTNDREQANELYRKAFTIALNRPFSRNCTAACVVFLELLGFDSRLFKVDLEVSRRILLHLSFKTTEKPPSNSELFSLLFSNNTKPLIKKNVLQPIIELFLNIPFQSLENMASDSPIHSSELLNLLRLLEDATREMESLQYFHKEKTKIHSPWQLVSSFCQFHNLPRSLTLLHELARNNEWIMLLYEAYSQKCPIDTLQDIIEKYLYEGPLQRHLLNMISSLNNKQNVLYWDIETLNNTPLPSLFEELLRFTDKSYKGLILRLQALINHLISRQKVQGPELQPFIIGMALELKKPFFVVLGYALWGQQDKIQGFAILINILAFQMLGFEKNLKLKEELKNSLRLNSYINNKDLAKLVIVLCLMRKTKEIITALKLFFPLSRLLLFLRFWNKLCKRDFAQAFHKLNQFLQKNYNMKENNQRNNENNDNIIENIFINNINENINENYENINETIDNNIDNNSKSHLPEAFALDYPPILQKIVFTLFTRICEDDFLTDYEMGKLLEILYYLDFNPIFSNYYITFIFLEKLRPFTIENPVFQLKYSSNPLKIYQTLINYSLIEEAKAYADYFNISQIYAIIGELVVKFQKILQFDLLKGLDQEVCLIFHMVKDKFSLESAEIAFQWIYQLNQSEWFSLKQQAFALFFSGCLGKELGKTLEKLDKIRFKLFYILYSCGFEVYKEDKRKGFLDFPFDLKNLANFQRVLADLEYNKGKSKRLCFKSLSFETAFETCKRALNRLDLDFIRHFISFKPHLGFLTDLKGLELYKLMDEVFKNEDFWELEYDNLLFLLQNPEINLAMYDDRLKGILSLTYLQDYGPFVKSIFLLVQLTKKLNTKRPYFNSVKDLLVSIKVQPLEELFKVLMDKGQNLLIKGYFKLINLDPIIQISIMLNYFLFKAINEFWTFQQYIEFVEITPEHGVLAQILINYTKYNPLNTEEKIRIYTLLYFASILSCRVQYLDKAFVLLKEVILKALEFGDYRTLEFLFTTILDFSYLNEVFEQVPEEVKGVVRGVIEGLHHCLEAFHLPLIKTFRDQGLLVRFLKNKKIYRKLGSFFYKKAFEASENLLKEKMKGKEYKKKEFMKVFEGIKGVKLGVRDKEKLLVIWESLFSAKEFFLKEEVYEKAFECLKGIKMVYELMQDLCI